MEDKKDLIEKKIEKELMENIQLQYTRGDYNAALALIDDYISRVGIDKQIYLLREKIQDLKKSAQGKAAPSKPSDLKVVSAFDELSLSSDSMEFKSADVEASIVSSLKKKKEEKTQEPEEDLRITDDDILELKKEIEVPQSIDLDQPPAPPAVKEKKGDTRPFDLIQLEEEELAQPDLQLHVPFFEDGTPTGTQLSKTEKDRYEIDDVLAGPPPGAAQKKEEEIPAKATPVPAAASETRVPPADKEFVAQLEAELNKVRKKPDFSPSFLKTESPKREAAPFFSPPPTSVRSEPLPDYDNEVVEPERKPITLTEDKGPSKRPLILIGGGVVAVAALFALLKLTGILGGGKGEPEPAVQQQVQSDRRPRRQVQPKPTGTAGAVTTQTETPLTPEKQFGQLLDQAEKAFAAADIKTSWELILQAQKIKTDLRLVALKNKVEEKMLDLQASAPERAEMEKKQKDDNDYTAAGKLDTREAYNEYLKAHPMGLHQADALKRIQDLEKEEQKNFEIKILEKVRTTRAVELRSQYLYLTKEAIELNWSKLKKTAVNYEEKIIANNQVIIDYATGLMWYRMEKMIDFQRAQWFASRRFANYSNWRLPTSDEAKTLLGIVQRFFAAAGEMAVWTGDRDAVEQVLAWTVKLPAGTLAKSEFDQGKTLFAVRTIK